MKTRGRRIALASGTIAIVLIALAAYLGWPHLVFWCRFESLGANAKGLAEYRHRESGIDFVRCPAGTGFNLEGKETVLSPYLIAKRQVQQGEWDRIMADTEWKNLAGSSAANLVTTAWPAGTMFCERTGLSLPTFAQWLHAHRCGSDLDLTVPKDFFYEWTSEGVHGGPGIESDIRATRPVGFRPAYGPPLP